MSELFQYKCPNCGGALKFDSRAQLLKCPFCDSEISVESLNDQENELGLKDDSLRWEDIADTNWEPDEALRLRTYVCDSCGGEIITDENTVASRCPYCDNNVVMKGNVEGTLKPDIVIPFKISKEQAKEAYLRHISGKPFLPKTFRDDNQIDEMKAMYVPFWLFDCDAQAAIRYDGTKVRAWADRRNNYVRTEHYDVIREGSLGFDNVPVDGSIAMPDELVQSVEPFDCREAVPFKTAYLAGYLADKYTLGVRDAIPFANERVKESVALGFRTTVSGYSTVTTKEAHVHVANGRNRYAMYPLWILNTTFNGERYIFSINGQTGKTAGDLPMDKGAYWRHFLKWTGLITIGLLAAEIAVLFGSAFM